MNTYFIIQFIKHTHRVLAFRFCVIMPYTKQNFITLGGLCYASVIGSKRYFTAQCFECNKEKLKALAIILHMH